MRTKIVLTALLLSSFALQAARAEEHEDLERLMKAMNRPYKALTKQVADKTKNAESLKLLAAFESATVAAKAVLPEEFDKLPKEQKDKASDDYRSRLVTCLILAAEAEQALLDDDNDAAVKKIDSLKETMKDGHKEYRKEHD